MAYGAHLKAAKIFLYANQSVNLHTDSTLESTHPNTCTTAPDGNMDMYQCIDPDQIHTFNMTREEILQFYNR